MKKFQLRIYDDSLHEKMIELSKTGSKPSVNQQINQMINDKFSGNREHVVRTEEAKIAK